MLRDWAVVMSASPACSSGSLDVAVVPVNCFTEDNCLTVSYEAQKAVAVEPTRSNVDCAVEAQSKFAHVEPGTVMVAIAGEVNDCEQSGRG